MEIPETSDQAAELFSFDAVYESELATLVRLASLMLGSRALGEEAVHDAFLQLHRSSGSVRNPGGFLRTATVNRCRDIQRRRVRSDRFLRSALPAGENEPHYLLDALKRLPALRRSVVVLRFYGGYKLREIAELLDIPEGTVRSNLSRGLDELREVLR